MILLFASVFEKGKEEVGSDKGANICAYMGRARDHVMYALTYTPWRVVSQLPPFKSSKSTRVAIAEKSFWKTEGVHPMLGKAASGDFGGVLRRARN